MAVLELAAFGIIGSVLLSIAFLPQCYRMLSTKSARDISAYYMMILVAGSFCLTVYGYGIRDLIVFILNLYATLANSELLLLKIYYDSKKENKDPI
jgi:MtN3 and saliva related transmembrane protein